MNLHELKKLKKKSKKRVGRGYSSGKGKTASRGAKGQKKRGKIKIGFEGGQVPLQKRLPQKRGLGNAKITKAITLTISQLNLLPPRSVVDMKALKEFGLIRGNLNKMRIKIVAKGKIDKPLNITLPTSEKAVSIIKKAGGSLLNEDPD